MDEVVDVVSPPVTHPVSAPAPSAAAGPRSLPQWRPTGAALLLLLGWILLLYRDTAIEMVAIWQRSETFAHAFLVPPIVLWLVWRQRHTLAAQTPKAALWALLPAAALAFAWLLGDLATVNSVTQFAMTGLLVTATLALLGAPVAHTILFPLVFSFFVVPFGEFLMPQLMEWTANFTVFALRLSGIPVFREGLSFVIPSGYWSVVEACSGVRYLIASFMVGTLFAYLNYQTRWRRALFIGVSLLVPIVANWLRAYLIVLLGHVSSNKLAVGADHLIYGWVFFGFVILLMFWIGAKWGEPDGLVDHKPAPALPIRQPVVSARRTWAVACGISLLVAVPHAAKWLIDSSTPNAPVHLVPLANPSPQWAAVGGSALTEFKPAFHNPSAEFNTAYANAGSELGLYVGYYRRQDGQHKLVGSGNVLVPSTGSPWNQLATGRHTVDAAGRQLTFHTATLRRAPSVASSGQTDLLVWQTYWVNGGFTASDPVAKAQIALGRLLGRGDDSAVVVVYAPAEPAGAAALQAFVEANLAAIERQLLSTRGAQR